MSDWITHIGWAYLPARMSVGPRLRLALIGAILPDLCTPLIVLANNLHLHPGLVESYLQPLQAPLPTALFALAIAFLTPAVGASFLALAVGAVVHYALDLTQVRYGGGIFLTFPHSFQSPSFDLYWPESITNVALLLFGAVGLGWALTRPGPRIEWRRRRWLVALGLAAIAFTLPALTVDQYHQENVNNIAFFRQPESFEGRIVSFGQSEVESIARRRGDGPYRIRIKKGPYEADARIASFERWGAVSTDLPVPGTRISFRGVYRNGTIVADGPAHVHFRPLRTWTSLVGLFAIVLLVIPGTPLTRRARPPHV